jgi:LAGLIDADG DNA endonuclease family protein
MVDAPIAEGAMDLDDSFGHWFAGLVDGKAIFAIARVSSLSAPHRVRPTYRVEIMLPADDQPILAAIRDRLGCGSLVLVKRTGRRRLDSDQLKLTIHRIEDCVRLIEVLRRYPLRTNKRLQFDVWARAVKEATKGEARSDRVIGAARAELARLRRTGPGSDDVSIGRDYGESPACLCGCGQKTSLIANLTSSPHPDNPEFCSFIRSHYRPAGRRPRCLCGCGQMTSLARHPASRLHPEDPNYCSFIRSHQNRLRRATGHTQ